jgi:hypothetical protein
MDDLILFLGLLPKPQLGGIPYCIDTSLEDRSLIVVENAMDKMYITI